MPKETFTRQEVAELIDKILEYPTQVTDAINNEYTDWHGEELMELVDA